MAKLGSLGSCGGVEYISRGRLPPPKSWKSSAYFPNVPSDVQQSSSIFADVSRQECNHCSCRNYATRGKFHTSECHLSVKQWKCIVNHVDICMLCTCNASECATAKMLVKLSPFQDLTVPPQTVPMTICLICGDCKVDTGFGKRLNNAEVLGYAFPVRCWRVNPPNPVRPMTPLSTCKQAVNQ